MARRKRARAPGKRGKRRDDEATSENLPPIIDLTPEQEEALHAAKRAWEAADEAERERMGIRRKIDRNRAIESGLATKRRTGSREQDLIRQIAADQWPDGHDHIATRVIIKVVSDELERRGEAVPKRDVFLRALDRRKG